jgi:hypothetical protein
MGKVIMERRLQGSQQGKCEDEDVYFKAKGELKKKDCLVYYNAMKDHLLFY